MLVAKEFENESMFDISTAIWSKHQQVENIVKAQKIQIRDLHKEIFDLESELKEFRKDEETKREESP